MHDLIVFGEDLGGLPSSTQHLVKRLARNRKVLWINSIGLRQPGLNTKDISRMYRKLFPHKEKVHTTSFSHVNYHNIIEVNLLTIPAPSSTLARKLATEMMLHQLRPILDRLQLKTPILWVSLPTAVDICEHIDHSALVYYCGDDFSSLAGVDHHTVRRHEEKLTECADLILVPSEKLKKTFPAVKTHLLPHGVDTELFATPTIIADDFPCHDSKGIRCPIAGYYGSLSEWLDYELIEHAATTLPDWNFVFIGPQMISTNCLPKRDNIHYLGTRAHHELPRYSQHWNVGILPFKKNAQIESCNPLKLLEYLAAGQPVVSVEFPALSPYKEYVHTSNDNVEFVQALLLAKTSPRIPQHTVNGHSWDDRGQDLNWILESV